MTRIAIDVGISGAIAMLDDANRFVGVVDMPVMAWSVKSKIVNGAELSKWLRTWKEKYSPITVVIERVGLRPGQGMSSQGNFLMNFGVVLGCVMSAGLPYILVSPQTWKRRATLPKRKKDQDKAEYKDMARILAQQLYPEAPLGLKKFGGRADSILIARFGEPDKLL